MEEMMNYVRAALKFQVTATASRKTMTVEDINAELTKCRNELATLYKAKDDLLKERARGE